MDLDLARVRAFVAVVDEGHFGRAAELLSVSQQGLSKRIARLEAEVGTRLLARGPRGVRLTDAGQRFLEPARRLLAAADLAAAVAMDRGMPLRLDVWGHLFDPMRTVRRALAHAVRPRVEPGSARDLPAVISALERGETDAGFGRVYLDGGRAGSGDLARRLVRLEPVDAVLAGGHELAGRDSLRPADLRDSMLVFPAAGERLDFLTRFADWFAVADRCYGANLGLAHLLDQVRSAPRGFTLLPAEAVPSPGAAPCAGVRAVPLTDPVPLYAWSLIWRRDDQHPQLPALLDAFAGTGRVSRWLEYRPGADWLPEPDQAAAMAATGRSGT